MPLLLACLDLPGCQCCSLFLSPFSLGLYFPSFLLPCSTAPTPDFSLISFSLLCPIFTLGKGETPLTGDRPYHSGGKSVDLGKGTGQDFCLEGDGRGFCWSKISTGTWVQLDKHCLGLCSAATDQVLGAAMEETGARAS